MSLGVMIDCSRDAVMTVDKLKDFITILAKFGYDSVQLYTEDTYEIDGEPYFGYMRGRYTQEEISTLDKFCRKLGVELIPCVQTLAHLNQMLRWHTYADINDVNDILLVDERSEIAAVHAGVAQLNVGIGTDIISNCTKSYAFSYGIRSMRPDVIVTDELMGEEDFEAVADAIAGGVAVIASVHASTPEELFVRRGFKELYDKKIITRYVFLSDRNGPGTYENVYDADMKRLYLAS